MTKKLNQVSLGCLIISAKTKKRKKENEIKIRKLDNVDFDLGIHVYALGTILARLKIIACVFNSSKLASWRSLWPANSLKKEREIKSILASKR